MKGEITAIASEQIANAMTFGAKSKSKGIDINSFQDEYIMEIMSRRGYSDNAPNGEASTKSIVSAWRHGYDGGSIPPKPNQITKENFFISTVAQFKKQSKKHINKLGKPDFVSDSGSKYWYKGKLLYRYSDHWGEVSTCVWDINKKRKNNQYTLGVTKFSAMKRFILVSFSEIDNIKINENDKLSDAITRLKYMVKSHTRVMHEKFFVKTIKAPNFLCEFYKSGKFTIRYDICHKGYISESNKYPYTNVRILEEDFIKFNALMNGLKRAFVTKLKEFVSKIDTTEHILENKQAEFVELINTIHLLNVNYS